MNLKRTTGRGSNLITSDKPDPDKPEPNLATKTQRKSKAISRVSRKEAQKIQIISASPALFGGRYSCLFEKNLIPSLRITAFASTDERVKEHRA